MKRQLKAYARASAFLAATLVGMSACKGRPETHLAKPLHAIPAMSSPSLIGLWASSDRIQRAAFEGSTLSLEDSFVNSSGDGYDTETNDLQASFSIKSIASSELNKLYVAGVADNGDSVVESWRIRKKTAVLGGSPILTALGTEIYRGQGLGVIAAIGVDPDSRFLMLLHGSPAQVSKMSLSSGHSATSVAAGFPFLDEASFMSRMQHATEGRLWFVQSLTNSDILILSDLTNDGNFETSAILTADEWKAAYYGTVWVNDFINH